MNWHTILEWFFANVEVIIFGTLIVILSLGAFYLFLNLREYGDDDGAHVAGGSVGPNIKEMEHTLRRVIESAQPPPTKVIHESADGAPLASAPAGASVDVEELTNLKDQLAERERLVGELKTSIADLKTQQSEVSEGQPAADTTKFETEIQDLQAKLAEYEIIEDDIANLSLYKDENTRLKEELEKLRSGDSGVSEVSEGDIDAIAAEEAAPKEEPAPTEEPAAEKAEVPEEDGDIMSQFEATMKDSDDSEPPADAQPTAEAAAQAPEEGKEAGGPDALAGSLDTEKLIEQVEELKDVKDEGGQEGEEEDGDPSHKLISEFESFMKDSE